VMVVVIALVVDYLLVLLGRLLMPWTRKQKLVRPPIERVSAVGGAA